MQIEKDDIKRLRKAFYSIHSQIILASKKNGCKFNLLWFLYALDSEELKSQKQICEEWYMTKTTLNTLVKECEKLGYINFKPIDGEKREKYIILTDSGKKYMNTMISKLYIAEEKALLKIKDRKKFIENMEEFFIYLKESINENC